MKFGFLKLDVLFIFDFYGICNGCFLIVKLFFNDMYLYLIGIQIKEFGELNILGVEWNEGATEGVVVRDFYIERFI